MVKLQLLSVALMEQRYCLTEVGACVALSSMQDKILLVFEVGFTFSCFYTTLITKSSLLVIKIEAVTRRILWIKLTQPKAKVLVFSSWKDVLDVLEHAFTANDVSYARMKGGR